MAQTATASTDNTTVATQQTEAEADIVAEVTKDYQNAWRSKRQKENMFMDIYRRYRSYLDSTQQTTRSSLFIPESFTLVETVAPRMTANNPGFVVLPRDSKDIEAADRVGKMLDYQYDRTNLQHKLKKYVKQGLMYGTSFLKVGWDNDNNMPAVEPVDIADINGDPAVWNWDKGYIIHRFYSTVTELKNSTVKYKNLDQLANRKKTMPKDDYMRQQRLAIQGVPAVYEYDGFEVMEEWKFVDGLVRVRTIADREVLIRDDETPFDLNELPFIVLFDQEVPFEKWGIGEIEPIIALQDEENTIRNQRIDEKNLSIHNMWVVDKTAGIDYNRITSKPGGIILATNINGIRPLEKQNITQDSVAEIQMIKGDIQQTTGVNDVIKGNGQNDSATGAALNNQQGNERFAEKIANLEISLKNLGRWMVALNAQFQVKEQNFQVMGKFGYESQKVSLKDIRGQYDIDIESGSSLPSNPDLRRQQLNQLTQMLAPFLMNPNGIPDGMRELLRNLIQSFDLKNVDEILQGAQHPLVNQAMANLQPGEMDGANPQMIEQAIKQKLMARGQLQPVQPEQTGAAAGQMRMAPAAPAAQPPQPTL